MKTHHFVLGRVLVLVATLLVVAAASQEALPQSLPKRALLTQNIDERVLLTIQGSTRPEANAANDGGPVPADFPMEHMFLQLRRPPELERAIDQFIDQLHNRKSPTFHRWLTAKEFGEKYGLAQEDLDKVTLWLRSHGFTVNLIYRNGMLIDFSGTASQVSETFHTEIHQLRVKGVQHFANMSDPKIPAALAPAVVGVVSMHDFKPEPTSHPRVNTNYTSAAAGYLVVPADLATIYNLNPLFSLGYTGQGQTIVVVELTDVYTPADWGSFRSVFGLSGYTSGSLTQIHPPSSGTNNCSDPGALPGAEGEATLDAEWASAAAPSAAIVLASCAEATTHGWFIALQNLLNAAGTPPAIVSMSYGVSETVLGPTANAAIYAAYQQGAAEGVSIFVSSGDAAAVNNDRGSAEATHGININGFATTPYNVAVGGTDFSDFFSGTLNTYWSPTNGPTFGSALSYVPETTWNGSCASTLIAQFVTGSPLTYGLLGFCNSAAAAVGGALNVEGGAGGPSGCAAGTPSTPGVVSGTCVGYAKPSWQSIIGNPKDGVRDIPDVSLFSSAGVWGHAYVFCMSDTANGGSPCSGTPDTWSSSGGTSFAAPIMAGIQALANQATLSRWGNPNPMYYYLANSEYGNSGSSKCNSSLGNGVDTSCIFYDVTLGDTAVPCLGTANCYTPSGTIGVLSTSDAAYQPAYATNVGWDFASGIGSVNAYNLVAGFYANTSFPLTIVLAGAGSGTVTSNPTGISCPGVCSARASIGLAVTLTATPAAGSTFAGWSGACAGTGACIVTMNGTKSVTATFNLNSGPGVKLSPPSLNFGTVATGTTSAAKTVTLTNVGTTSLTIAGIAITGTNPGDFAQTNTCGSSLAAAASCTIRVTFKPAATGTRSAVLGVTDNASGSPQHVPLSGVGTTAKLSLSSLSFGSVTVGTTSLAKLVTLTNVGTTSLTIASIAITGTNAGDFAQTHTCGSSLAAGASCTISVTFKPTAKGTRTAAVSLIDNAAGNPQKVALSGTGT